MVNDKSNKDSSDRKDHEKTRIADIEKSGLNETPETQNANNLGDSYNNNLQDANVENVQQSNIKKEDAKSDTDLDEDKKDPKKDLKNINRSNFGDNANADIRKESHNRNL